MLLAAFAAVIVSVIALVAIAQVDWPAFPSSNQLRVDHRRPGRRSGRTGRGGLAVATRRSPARPAHRTSAVGGVRGCHPGHAAGATKLYLFGVSVDQQFRTEYLTRLTDSPALHDMTYIGLPPFYPPGWFWIGGGQLP